MPQPGILAGWTMSSTWMPLSSRSSVERWKSTGFVVGPVTWRDQGDGWPPQLKTDRAQVTDADSIGVTLRKAQQEGEVVLFKAGFCDFMYWAGEETDHPVLDAPGYPDTMTVEGFGTVLDRLTALFL
jgi:hypothetical protein